MIDETLPERDATDSQPEDHTDGILAADDTGLVRNEILITEVELREGELLPPT